MKKFVTIGLFFLYFRCTLQSNNTFVNCTISKKIFTNYVSEFTSCAIENARPITLCESCVDAFIDVVESYDNLTKYSDEDSTCIKKLINLDRLEVVLTLYENANSLWKRAKCYECFVIHDGKLTHNRSEHTLKFNELYNVTVKCINDTNQKPEHMCSNCLDGYLKLNDYYIDMIDENDKIAGCMDIVDVMNTTRSFWSEKCCKTRKRNETIFLVCTGCMSLIAILFYVFTKMFTDMKTPIVFKQSRLTESLGRIN